MAILRSITKRNCCIVVFTIVHPLGDLGLRLTSKLMAIELAYKVLCCVSAKRSSWVNVAHQHPLLLTSTTNWQLHHIGAFPNATMVAILATKAAFKGPLLQVGRRIELHLLTGSKNHNPLLSWFMPENLWVAEIWNIAGYHRVLLIFSKSTASISRICH